MTPQEVKLWVRLRELRALGHHFRRQSPIPPYIVDSNAGVPDWLSKLMEDNTPWANTFTGTLFVIDIWVARAIAFCGSEITKSRANSRLSWR
jgi:hypothetical protein